MTRAPWEEVAREAGLDVATTRDGELTLRGRRRGVAVTVRPLMMKAVGSNENLVEPTHTTAIAEIDPPLYAGLRLFTRDLVPFFGVAMNDEPTLHPALEARFLMYAFDAPRAREVLLPSSFGHTLAQASRSCSLVVKDAAVEAIAYGGYADIERVEGLVEIATSLAAELTVRSQGIKHTPLEIEARNAWQRVAARLGLSVDPLRWLIFGKLGDVAVTARLEGSPPAVSTTFRAQLRAPMPVPFVLRRDHQGLQTGFPELDALFVLASPQMAEARALFADPALRTLLAVEGRTSNFTLDDHQIVSGRGGFAGTKEIEQRLQSLVAIVDRLTPAVRGAGPFR